MEKDDVELIQKTLSGNGAAFSTLVKKYQKGVHALVWRKVKDFHIAEEITQDTFLQAHRKLASLKNPSQFPGWLYVIADRLCRSWFRKKRLKNIQSLETTDEETLEKTAYSDYICEQREAAAVECQREIVQRLMAQLPESERTVMVLYYLGEMNCKEISKFLGVSPHTVKSRLRRARERLQNEEHILHETFGSIPLHPNLTESIMRNIDTVQPPSPSGSKPLPWVALASSAVFAFLLMSASTQYLARSQPPHSLDAELETTIEIVDAPVVVDIQSKPSLQNRVGHDAIRNKNSNNGLSTGTESMPSNIAQDVTQWNLPEKAKARFGKGTLTDCVYLPDGNRLAVLSSIGTWTYDVRTGEALDLITEPFTDNMRLSPDGKTLAAASEGSVYLWDMHANKLKKVLVGAPTWIYSLTFSPNGKTLAGGKSDKTVYLWDTRTGELLKTFIGHTAHIDSVAHSNDGKMLASVAWEDNAIRLWDVATGHLLKEITERPKRIYSLIYSPDSRTLVGSGSDSNIHLWDVGTGALLKTLTGHTSAVNTMTYSPDGKTLVSGSWDKTIRFWNASTGKLLKTLTGHTEVVDTVIYAPDGKTVTSMSSYDGTIRFWDAETTKLLKTITGHTGSFGRAVAFSPDGQMLAHSGTADNTIPIRDVQSGQLLRTLTGHTDTVLSIAYSPDGRNLVSGNWDGHIRMWDVDTGVLLKTLTGHEKGVPSLVYSPDGATLISGSWDNTIRIWDINTGQPLQTIIGNTTELEPSQGVRVISLSPDGQTIASATDEKVIRLWDVHTGKLTDSLVGHTNEVAAVAFSPRGTVLASGGDDATLRLWDVEAGKLLNTFKEPTRSSVLSVAFSPDGRILASGCYAMVRLRDTFTERNTVTLTGHTTWVRALAFSPDGRILASIDEDGVVILWDMNQVKWQ